MNTPMFPITVITNVVIIAAIVVGLIILAIKHGMNGNEEEKDNDNNDQEWKIGREFISLPILMHIDIAWHN